MDGIDIVVALGANLPPEREKIIENLRRVIDALAHKMVSEVEVSGFYATTAYPSSDQPDFVNCALKGRTNETPETLLGCFHALEDDLGRSRLDRWDSRTMDIDLILYGDTILPDLDVWHSLASHEDETVYLDTPMVPHPRAHVRDFVLRPVIDVAADMRHPIYQKTMAQLYERLMHQNLNDGVSSPSAATLIQRLPDKARE